MSESKKKAASGVAAPRDGKGCGLVSEYPLIDCTTLPGWTQAGIARLLGTGKGAAISARELADFLDIKHERDISRAVERDRRAGIPICASSDKGCSGYYLPHDIGELDRYRLSLRRRVNETSKTLQAIEDVYDWITGQQQIDMEAIE